MQKLKRIHNLYTAIFSLVIISGCNQARLHLSSSLPSSSFSHELQARHYDLPLFSQARLVPQESSDSSEHGTLIVYTVSASLHELYNFYRAEMERLGWRYSYSVEGIEYVVCFEKPHKHATISLRPRGTGAQVVIAAQRKA